MTDFDEVRAVWRGEVTRALRSGRVAVLLLLFLMFVALALTIVGFVNHQFNARFDQQIANAGADVAQAREALTSQKRDFLALFFTDDPAMLDSLSTLPLVLLVVFKLTLRFVPLLVALMGFDQLAGEIGPKSIRYLVVRVKRNSLILGKWLAQVTVFGLLVSVSTVVMVLVAKVLNPDFAPADVVTWLGRLLVSSFVLALAYLSLTTLCSSVVRQGAVALVLNIIVLFSVWFIALIGEVYRFPHEVVTNVLSEFRAESMFAYLRYASVWHFGQDLLHPHWPRFITAVIMHAGFALAFIGLAQVALSRRDV